MSGAVRAQVVVAALVLAVGAAFINLGSKYRTLQRKEQVRAAMDRTRRSVETVFSDLAESVSGAIRLSQDGTTDSALLCWPGSGWREAQPSRAWTEWFAAEIRRAEYDSWHSVVGPYRSDDGTLRVVVRVPVASLSGQSPAPSWCGLAVDLEEVFRRSDLGRLVEDGFTYRLRYDDPVYRETWDVANLGLLEDVSVSGEIAHTASRWKLAVSRVDQPFWASTAIALGSLGLVLMAGLAVTRDYALRLERSQEDLEGAQNGSKRIRSRLLDEARRRRALDRQFTHSAFHDTATGLPNDSFFMNRLERALQRVRISDAEGLAVLRLRPLQLETVAAACTHGSPDLILGDAARRVEHSLRPSDLVLARSGTDITVLLYHVSSVDPAVAAAERILETFQEPLATDGEPVYLNVRIGISYASTGFEQPRELLRQASIAAIVDGERPGVCVFDHSFSDQLVSLQQLDRDLRVAIDQGDFAPYYQPIVSLIDESIVGFETLLRWQHPQLGLLTPDRFITLAEDSGIVHQITRWLIQASCARIREWQDRLPPDRVFYFGVNLSPNDLGQPDLAEFVVRQIRSYGIPPTALRLEVTEGAMIESAMTATVLMERLRSDGVAMMLDDFGAGYSSLGYLHRFRFDYLKLDRSFIQKMRPSNESSRIVKAVLDLAHGLGMKVIAEGIETRDVLESLRRMSCDYGQGFYFARPLPPLQAFEMLAKGKCGD